MADAVVKLLFNNLDSLIQREFGLIWGVEDDINKLSSLLSTIQAVLQDAEMKQFTVKPIADWLAKLKDTAYDAGDVMDEWLADTPDGTCALSLFSPNHIKVRYSIAKKIKKIITRLDEIAEERIKFHLSPNVMQTEFQLDGNRETSSFLSEEVVYGRDHEKKNVIDVLLSNVSCGENISIFSILGIGGLGKTTLAQLVYQDQAVIQHFDTRIWVCVSNDFGLKRLTKMLIESLTGNTCGLNDLDPMQRQLQQILSGKRFLLVLDDLWNEDPDEWQKLKSSLKCGAYGSSILVTPRHETVTSVVGTPPPCRLAYLSENESWLLLKSRAFGVGNEENADLVKIGKQILKKCGGVPLAAKALGGLLFSKQVLNDWLQVRDSAIWELPHREVNGILPSLRLSYQHLPLHVKQCFAFCSIYPKDYRIYKEEVIHLWMANGLLQCDERMELEDLGNKVFIELLQRSFFQEIEKDDVGDIQTCKMYDIMHDLACSVSANECCVMEAGTTDTYPKGVRYGSLVFYSSVATPPSNLQSLFNSNLVLRTQLMLGYNKVSIEFAHISFKKLPCLRVLDLSGTKTKMLHDSIGKLKHLRYLNLSETKIEFLHEVVCSLRKLESLKLRNCFELKSLPEHMSKMSSLRHLDMRGCYLTEMPTGMGRLIQLQTLSIFLVGSETGRSITELHGLNHLRGEIEIKGLEQVRNLEEVKAGYLSTKQNVSSLILNWLWLEKGADGELQEKVLEEGLQPHPNLKALSIRDYKGAMMPTWIKRLQSLVKISIVGCKRCECVPSLGKLPLLKLLRISGMDPVTCFANEFYGEGVGGETVIQASWFPSLEQLEISSMSNLKEWTLPSSSSSSSSVVFPCLKRLTIEGCPMLTTIPFLPCVQELRLHRCNELILTSLGNLDRLVTLVISKFGEMTCIPEGIFVNSAATLQSLEIHFCNGLESIPREIRTLKALASLWISGCRNLTFLSELEKLTSLRLLQIWECGRIECLPVMGIQGSENSLTELLIWDCANLTSLSEGLRYLTSLQTLHIRDCPKVELSREDDFQHLISLRRLQFLQLPQFRALPEWLQHCPALQYLEIKDCHPDVHRRCEKEKGDDWHIISHIPELDINLTDSEPSPASSSLSPKQPPTPSRGSSSFGVLSKLMFTCYNNDT